MRASREIGAVIVAIVALVVGGYFWLVHIQNNEKNASIEQVSVILDWAPNTNHTGLYVASCKNFYNDEGLQVKIIESSYNGGVDAIASSKADFGISFQEEVMYARTSDTPLPVRAIAAIIQHNTSGFASLKNKEITTPRDFEGKRYGGWGLRSESAVLSAVMKRCGADFSKVQIINVSSLDFIAAQKSVDFSWVYYGWDIIAAKLNGMEVNFMKLTDLDPELESYTPVIVCNENLINKRPELVRRFMRATKKGYLYSIDNPDDAAKILISSVPGINAELVMESQKYMSKNYTSDPKHWGKMDKKIWKTYGNWMYKNSLLENELEAEGAFTNEYVQ